MITMSENTINNLNLDSLDLYDEHDFKNQSNHMNQSSDNVPKLRFPEFKSENGSYKRHCFNDIFLFSTGKNIKQNEASPEFETPCVRYGELYHMYNEVISEIINRTNIDKSELLFSDGDEILLPSAGEDPLDIGSALALTVKNVAIGRTINILKPAKANIYSQIYVAYYINQKLRKTISTLAKGVSISNVYNSDLKTLEIMLPNLPEQTRIATFLTAVDSKLQSLKKKKSLLEEYKKGVMQKLFSQELRFKPALSEVEGDENGKDFPDWETKKVRDVFKITRGNVLAMTLTKDKKVDEHIYPVYSSQTKNKGLAGYYKEYLFENAITWTTDGAGAGDVNYRNGKFYCTNVCGVLISGEGYANLFIAEILNSVSRKYVSYVGNPKLMNNVMAEIPIYIPSSISEQYKISNFLTSIDEKINHCQKQIEKTEVWKKGLLQKMFV
jgi:type I restriction enzyme, S subunit